MDYWEENMKNKFYVTAEFREDYPNDTELAKNFNDHIKKESIDCLVSTINKLGYECKFYGGINSLLKINTFEQNIIFINYNYGKTEQHKRAQAPLLLEMANVKYSGSDPFVSLLVNDKAFTNKILTASDITTPQHILYYKNSVLPKEIQFPVIVKPNASSSSLGITQNSIAYNYEELSQILNKQKKYLPLIIENYISGYEITVWIIGNKDRFSLVAPLLISKKEKEFFMKKDVFTFEDKANHQRFFHNPYNILSKELVSKVCEIAKRCFTILNMRDYGRLDFRVDESGNIFFLEANALPGFSMSTDIGYVCQFYDYKYEDICSKLIETVLSRFNDQN